MQINVTACIVLSYVGLLGVAFVAEFIVTIKRWKEIKRGNFEKAEKYKKITRFLMLSPIIITLIPSIYLSVNQGGNLFLWLIASSIRPSIPFFAIGISAMVPSSAKANNPDQSTDLTPAEKRKQKIRATIIYAAAIVGLVLGITIGVLFQLDIL